MTGLEELLEQAADTGVPGFDADDVRRRVARRSRTRRLAVAGVAAAVLAGTGMLLASSDRTTDRLDVADEPGGSETGAWLLGRWEPAAYSAVVAPQEGVFLDFGTDDTLRGHDGCNSFTTTWSVEGNTLVIGDIEQTLIGCNPGQDTQLVDILRDGPTVSDDPDAPGELELRSERGFVTFERE
jgi:heat shock protein HslJ